ncbi:2-hydroxymuconate-semialdehyde hydrolase [Terriglobus roseus]|uniref:2-hydroxymuconate-semialdehyde hydrolase n=1 Tax=Terriglobus roseus TaxID=392734 RepID=A0A1G7I969_9BACT|nr:2-hydroxymuconate-semialdehyde hydrolase [Terriglobus roseus]
MVAVAGAYIYWNPLWLVDRSVNIYLRGKGIQHHYVMVDGYRIHYLEAKPEGNGPEKPVLLVHGLGARASDWAKMIPDLAKSGYHVYAPDLLGYGDSPKPADGDYTLDGEERIATDFQRALKLEQVDLGGWSMGGWVAMKMALDHPEMVRRLMVYDSAGMYFVLDFPPSLFSPHDRASFDALMDKIEPSRWRTKIPSIMIPGMIRRFQENQFIVQQTFGSMLHGRELLDFRLSGLKMPMLIVWGTEDRLIPLDVGLRMHDLVPQSVFLGVRKCGHLTAAECAPPVVDETIKFLNADPPLSRSTSYVDAPQ